MTSATVSSQPAFLVGVTGHINLDEADLGRIRHEVSLVLWRLRTPCGSSGVLNAAGELEPCDQPVLSRIPALGLSPDSLIVLSSLAPGADQLVAQVALEAGVRVMAALPFPHSFEDLVRGLPDGAEPDVQYAGGLYQNLTTFVRAEDSEQQNRERQLTYLRIAGRLLPEDRFLVRIHGDWGLSGEALADRLRRDAEDESRRNLRYRAAGEYIASSCDLLIAICNEGVKPSAAHVESGVRPALPVIPGDTECGASAVVRSRLFGTTPGLLPDISALTWADHGPVLRIWAENCGRSPRVGVARPERIPETELWSPESSGFLSPLGPTDEQTEQQRMQVLAEQVLRLRRLPQRRHDDGRVFDQLTNLKRHRVRLTWLESRLSSGRDWLRGRLRGGVGGTGAAAGVKRDAAKTGTAESLRASSRLIGLSLLYERANESSLRQDRLVKRMLKATPWLSLGGFLLLQISDNLKLRGELFRGPSLWSALWPSLIMLLSLVLFSLPWYWRRRLQISGVSDRQENDRAVAEALRVQFYWALAGLGKSTAQYYQQRERGELSWIRAVVSSAVMPVSGFQEEFEGLPVDLQVGRLRAVLCGWLRTQHSYFRRVAAEQNERLQRLTLVTQVLLVSGLTLLVLCSALGRVWLEGFLFRRHPLLLTLVAVGTAAGVVGWILLSGLRLKLKQLRDRVHAEDNEYLHREAAWVELCWRKVSRVLFCLACSVSLGILLAMSLLVLISSLGTVPRLFSDPLPLFQVSLAMICRNMCFAACAVVAARISFHFLPQNVPRYRSMLALFRGASMRMEALLERLEQQTVEEDRRNALRSIHVLLEDLGAEALVENAEWLKMHRISPPSPLMPSP